MANETSVDIDGMKAALPHFESAVNETTNVHNNMTGQRDALEASWTGDAARQFIPALNQWLDQCLIVKNQLLAVYEKLEQHTGVYHQVVRDTTDAATAVSQAVGAGLPGF
jgi:WXG100 family type VII secretion target